MNKVFQIGRLTKDPELSYTTNGKAVAKFSMAVSKKYTDSQGEKQEITSFFNCVAWGKTGELVSQYVKKGERLAIEGELEQKSWEDQDGNKRSTVQINVREVMFLAVKN